MQSQQTVAVVQNWQDAVNTQHIEQLLALSSPDIELIGPRGAGRGHQLVRDWLARAQITLTTQRIFARGAVVVVAQHATWRVGETGEVISEADVASVFRIAENRVVSFARYADLDEAFKQAGLTYADEYIL